MRISAFQFFTLLLLAMVASPVLLAQQAASSEDQHVSADRGSPLYRRSVFAHGYIHGYEDGFHEGDIDLQTGHDARDCKHIKEFRSADAGYRHAFGSRDEFRAAYVKALFRDIPTRWPDASSALSQPRAGQQRAYLSCQPRLAT